MKNIAIFGAGTMAHTYIDIIESTGEYKIVGLFDDRYPEVNKYQEFPVLGKTDDLPEMCKKHNIENIAVCIGDNYIRSIVVKKIREKVPNIKFPSVIHDKAYVSPRAHIGEGVVIRALTLIDAGVKLGDFTFIGGGSIVPHNSEISDYASISAGVNVGGEFKLGKFSYLGIGTTVFHCITVGENTLIGAGSVVTKDIPDNCVAYGVPAHVVKERKLGEKYL